MEIKVTCKENVAYVAIVGEIDTKAGFELSERFNEIIENDALQYVVLDLVAVPNISSAGIGKILKLFKHLSSKGGNIKIHGISAPLADLFHEIHLDRIIAIEPA